MATETLDHGSCIAAGEIQTSGEGVPSSCRAVGVVSYAEDGTGAVLLNLVDGIGESEALAFAQVQGAAMSTQIDRVSDTQIRITTRTEAGAASPGAAWFMVYRIPRNEVEA